MARLSFIAGLLGLLGLIGALRVDPNNTQKGSPLEMVRSRYAAATCTPPAAYRQQLTNIMDLQYFTQITLGGQLITGILDTGSFELMVFSRNCTSCGRAGVYSQDQSPTFMAGDDYKVMSYGSGACKAREGIDSVSLGCYNTTNQSLWLAMDCKMPLLRQAGFQSIVGVGPPGQPEFTARENIQQLEEIANKMMKEKGNVSDDLKAANVTAHQELEDALSKKSLLESFNMTTFSACLGRRPGQPGWMIWNDKTREGQPGVAKIPVAGNITWGIALENMSLEITPSASSDVKEVTEFNIGCENGCGAIVDTGTSLTAVPTTVFRAIADLVSKHLNAYDCSDLRDFPTLIFKAAGHKLRLPPSSYLGTITGMPSAQVAQLMHLDKQPSNINACQLLLMDLGTQMTAIGPLVILGMPLFREYYTTFDLGSGRGNRSILFAPADEACTPELSGKVKYNVNRDAFTPRHVDLSNVRVPAWIDGHSSIAV